MHLSIFYPALLTATNKSIEITNVPTLDLTITISVIVALSAIVSPIFTALINNLHDTKIKNLEVKQKEYENIVMYKRNLFERYLKHAGRCIYFSDIDASKDYGEYYFAALMCAPLEIHNEMVVINKHMQNGEFDKATELLELLTPKIHTMLQISSK